MKPRAFLPLALVALCPPAPPAQARPHPSALRRERLNRQQRRRALIAGHHRGSLRAVAWWRSEAREGRAHCIPAELAPFVLDAAHPLESGR